MPLTRHSSALLLVIAYLGFISLGLPDTLIGVAWPSVREAFSRQQVDIGWIFIGTGITYFLSSFFAGRLLTRMQIGTLLAVSSLCVAASAGGFGSSGWWWMFACFALLHGLGSGAIDSALNHYASRHFTARHMSWLHACFSIGATLGPLIMTAVISRTDSWRAGYFTVATFLLLLGLLFVFTRERWSEASPETPPTAQDAAATVSLLQALSLPVVRLQLVLFFVYTGLEAAAGQWSYTVLTESRQIPASTAGLWVTLYWASLAAGRIGSGFIVEWLGMTRLLRLSTLLAVAGAALFLWDDGTWLSALALSLTGLGLAAIFPCLMMQTPQRVGEGAAAHAIGFQVSAAMTGVALLPSLAGLLAQNLGLHTVPLLWLLLAIAVFFLHETLLRMTK
jgi:fucose permease